MRITENMRSLEAVSAQARSSERLNRATRTAGSGIRVAAPSDDPVAYSQMVRIDARITTLNSRARAASIASSDLEIAEGALAGAADVMTRARELAIQLSNGTIDPASRNSAATEVDRLRDALMGLANTKGSAGYLFGGTRTDQPPFDAGGNFVGNDTPMSVEIADGLLARGNASGADAFTASGGQDLVAALSTFATALRSNDVTTIRSSVGAFLTGHEQIVRERANTGVRIDRLRSATDVAESAGLKLQGARAGAVEADAPSAFSELMEARAAYERSLEITKQLLRLGSLSRG